MIPQKKKTHGLKIFHRFHFSSALKRMSVIAGHTPPGSMETEYIATVKGAPETIKAMVGATKNFPCNDTGQTSVFILLQPKTVTSKQ